MIVLLSRKHVVALWAGHVCRRELMENNSKDPNFMYDILPGIYMAFPRRYTTQFCVSSARIKL